MPQPTDRSALPLRPPLDGPASPDGPAPRGGPGRRGVRAPVVTGGAVLAAVAYLAVTDPYRPGRHLACPVLALTGLYCAGCGGQRAVHDLARLDLLSAWDRNPLVVLAGPVAVAAWVHWLRRRRAHRPVARWLRSPAVPVVLLGVLVVFAVLRNLPALAPYLAP